MLTSVNIKFLICFGRVRKSAAELVSNGIAGRNWATKSVKSKRHETITLRLCLKQFIMSAIGNFAEPTPQTLK